jgi:hypothetical protein
MMTLDEIRRRVEHVRVVAVEDDEMAHIEEDKLHRDVLAEIRDHCTDGACAELAGTALETWAIRFSRWYA